MITLTGHISQPLLRREDLNDEPIEQFTTWLNEAARGAVPQPLAATLATATANGQPLARTVLLKFYDAEGFVFFTDLGSRKVQHISENPQVSLLFPWLALNRQVNITGHAKKLGAIEAVKCFLLGQNNGVSARTAIEMQLAALSRSLGEGVLPMGPSWGGFRVVPETIEFFQGRGPREHDRFLFVRRADGSWEIEALE